MNLTGMPQVDPVNEIVANNGFYPDLGTVEFINDYAVATEYGNNNEMVKTNITLAIIDVNRELAKFKSINWPLFTQLQDIPSESIAGVSQLIILYQRSVFSRAKAAMLISRLGATHRDQRAAQQEQASDNQEYWQAQSDDAVRQIIGVSTIGVELL